MHLEEFTGRGVKIAVIDSGVHAGHPHIADSPVRRTLGGVVGGVAIRENGSLDDDYVDRLGHGTAVAAAIREKVPDAEIIAIKVFWNQLATDLATLIRAMDEACARRADVINLSLGTADFSHRAEMEAALLRAAASGTFTVAAVEAEGVRWLPGSLEHAVPVQLDWACPREAYRLVENGARTVLAASGYPREIPGVSRDRNLKGISFAVANATGFVARAREASPGGNTTELFEILAQGTIG
jgi:subtilisin family serine protease